ncbi:hypothetical protein MMC07_009201 [Pseudocyphellaria aurata]|nr:hypothetical protein [Pseudocyphellaria aurata]
MDYGRRFLSRIFYLPIIVGTNLAYALLRPIYYTRLYGIRGLLVGFFGAQNVWDMQAEVLRCRKDETAMDFRKSVQDESTTCAVAAAIVAQIAITALSLPLTRETYWQAQGFWIFSLISGIMSVYYASAQHRTVGRLLLPAQIRGWIRGGEYFEPIAVTDSGEEISAVEMRYSFMPQPSSVITISAPRLLLSTSLYSFLIGLGVYVVGVYLEELDDEADPNDSLNIWYTYIISFGVCQLIYSISNMNHGGYRKNPYVTVIDNAEEWYSEKRTIQNPSFTEMPNASIPHQPGSTTSLHGHGELPQTSPQHQALINALRESARLLQEFAQAEQLTARRYEQHLENQAARPPLGV